MTEAGKSSQKQAKAGGSRQRLAEVGGSRRKQAKGDGEAGRRRQKQAEADGRRRKQTEADVSSGKHTEAGGSRLKRPEQNRSENGVTTFNLNKMANIQSHESDNKREKKTGKKRKNKRAKNGQSNFLKSSFKVDEGRIFVTNNVPRLLTSSAAIKPIRKRLCAFNVQPGVLTNERTDLVTE